MKYEEVLRAIINSGFRWGMDDFGMIVGHRDDFPGKDFCPITAVCLVTSGVCYKPSEVFRAAEAIGMPATFAPLFVDAGDDVGTKGIFSTGMERGMIGQLWNQRVRRILKIRDDILRFTCLENTEQERLNRLGIRRPQTEEVLA